MLLKKFILHNGNKWLQVIIVRFKKKSYLTIFLIFNQNALIVQVLQNLQHIINIYKAIVIHNMEVMS